MYIKIELGMAEWALHMYVISLLIVSLYGDLTTGLSHFNLITGLSHYKVISLQGGLITGWSYYRVVSLQGGLITGWFHYRVISLQGGLVRQPSLHIQDPLNVMKSQSQGLTLSVRACASSV